MMKWFFHPSNRSFFCTMNEQATYIMRRRPHRGATDEAVTVRLEQLSSTINHHHSDRQENASPAMCSAQRKHAKQEKKLRKLQDSVERERRETMALRDAMDASFQHASERHTSFMRWYHQQNRDIEQKYALLGVYCPHITPSRRRFRDSSPGACLLQENSSVSANDDLGLSPSPANDSSAMVMSGADMSCATAASTATKRRLLSPSGGSPGLVRSPTRLDFAESRQAEACSSSQIEPTYQRTLTAQAPQSRGGVHDVPIFDLFPGSLKFQSSSCVGNVRSQTDTLRLCNGQHDINATENEANASLLRTIDPVVDCLALQIDLHRTLQRSSRN